MAVTTELTPDASPEPAIPTIERHFGRDLAKTAISTFVVVIVLLIIGTVVARQFVNRDQQLVIVPAASSTNQPYGDTSAAEGNSNAGASSGHASSALSVNSGPATCPTVDPAADITAQLTTLLQKLQWAHARQDVSCYNSAMMQPNWAGSFPDAGSGPIDLLYCGRNGLSSNTDLKFTAGGVLYGGDVVMVQGSDGSYRFASTEIELNDNLSLSQVPSGGCNPFPGQPNASTL